jgi:hypothetical protein
MMVNVYTMINTSETINWMQCKNMEYKQYMQKIYKAKML